VSADWIFWGGLAALFLLLIFVKGLRDLLTMLVRAGWELGRLIGLMAYHSLKLIKISLVFTIQSFSIIRRDAERRDAEKDVKTGVSKKRRPLRR
jgi:hypothetical protein